MSQEIAAQQRAEITKLARECEVNHQGDTRAAAESLFRRLQGSPALYAAVADPLVQAQCWHLIGQVKRKARTAVWNAPNYEKGLSDAADNVRHLSNANRTLMDDFPLPNGKRLGDATHADLIEAMTFYGQQARDMQSKAGFLAAVAGRVKGGKRVRDVLKETDLVALRDRATNVEAV